MWIFLACCISIFGLSLNGMEASTLNVKPDKGKEVIKEDSTESPSANVRKTRNATLTLEVLNLYKKHISIMPQVIKSWPAERKKEARKLI